MNIVSFKTDQPEAELSLFNGHELIEKHAYPADRNLASSIHSELKSLLKRHQLELADVKGIIVFKGPGSFTGLRIGMTVANTLAYALDIPIIGEMGDDWQKNAINALTRGENQKTVLPHYGAEPHTTEARK